MASISALGTDTSPTADLLIIGAGSTGLAVLESILGILATKGNAAKPTRITLLDDETFKRKRMSDHDNLGDLVVRASKVNAELSMVQGSAVDMQEQESSSTFAVITADQAFVHAKQVVLALGRFTRDSDFEHLSRAPRYLAPQERRPIPASATVGIAGSDRRAVAEVLRLLSAGHSGKILMVSKTGKLPRVGRDHAVDKKQLPNWRLSVLARKLQLRPIKGNLRLIRDALREEATAQGFNYDDLANQPGDPLEALRADIASNAPWAPLFRSFWNLIPDFWRSLPEDEIEEDEERWQFEHSFVATSPAFLDAIPMSDATKLEAALATGQVSLVRYENIDAVVPEGSTKEEFLISLEGGDARINVDYFVDVAVPETKLAWIKSQSPLLANLARRGLVEEHHRGGVEVNFNTLAARRRLHVIGSLTDGVHFRTMPEHSRTIAYSLLRMRRPRERLHIAVFVGPDLLSNIIASQAVEQIVNAGHLPFLYQIVDQDDLFQVPNLDSSVKEYLSYDRTLLRGHVFPAMGTSGGGRGRRNVLLLPPDGLRARYGICVQDMNAHGQAALQTLAAHSIDLGVILQPSRVVPHAFVKAIKAHFTSDNTSIAATAADLWTMAPGERHDNSIPALLAMRRGDSTMAITLEETLTMRTISTSRTVINSQRSVLRNAVAVNSAGVEMLLANIGLFAQDTIAGAASTPDRRSEARSRAPSTHEVEEAFMRGIKLVEREDVVDIVSDFYGSAQLKDVVRTAVYSIAMRIHGEKVEMEQQDKETAKSEDDDGGCLRWLRACFGLF